MKCKECPFFRIAYKPNMPWDMGLAICDKHNLEADYTSERKLNRLECIEEEENNA